MFLLELNDSYVQRKEAVLLADDATHVLKDSDVSACICVCAFCIACIHVNIWAQFERGR